MKAAFYTLGCKVNHNETAALQEMFRQGGFDIVPPGHAADVYVVNSCTVTAEGEAKSRRWLARMKRQNPGAVTVLTGCFPQAFPEKAADTAADIVTGTAGRAKLVEEVLAYGKEQGRRLAVLPHPAAFEELPAAPDRGKTRAFIKVQDGCNRRCAYCAIPAARGASRSRAEASILAEAALKSEGGCAEVVLTGINLPAYGRDTGTGLAALVERVAALPNVKRIRLGSLEPDLITPEDIRRFAAVGKLCRHFHLSLQSGCDATLRHMRRAYGTALYASVAETLRAAMPNASLTTDIIAGFPGETQSDFDKSLQFTLAQRFIKVHVFPFSPRPGTPAAEFEGQLPPAEKERRCAEMRRQTDAVREKIIEQKQGSPARVLLEQRREGGFTGYTEDYIPTLVQGADLTRGQVVPVELGPFDGRRCLCRPLAEG